MDEREKANKMNRLRIVDGKNAAKDDDIDIVVRMIAGHKGGGDQHNKDCEFDGKEFSATAGAGTNSATVRVKSRGRPTITLYEANAYGENVTIYRRGPWVQRAIDKAESIGDREAALARAKEDEKIRADADKFTPYPDDEAVASEEDDSDE